VTCSVCNVYIADVNISCNPDGSVHWDALVRNNAACTVFSPWRTDLQQQRNYSDTFTTVDAQTGSAAFPPGDSHVSGDFAPRTFPADTTFIRVQFRLTSNETACNPDPYSPMIEPCLVGGPTSTPVRATATRTPARTATATRTPVRATATRTAVGATATRTPVRATATPQACSVCNVYVPDVNIACNPDGTVHWTAVIRNNASCTVASPWKVELQVQKNYGGFTTVLTETGSGAFPPEDTLIGGDFCYAAPANATNLRVRFSLTSSERSCNPDPKSQMIAPCVPLDPCPVP
jgi:hypothetical protein